MRDKLVAILLVFLTATLAQADSKTLRWSELPEFVVNRQVSIRLRDGSQLRGKVIAAEPQQLVLEIRKTSKRQSIPRDQVTSLEVSRPTVRWRIVGTLVGAAAGVPLGAVAAIEKDGIFSTGSGGTALGIVVIGGLTAAGFLVGWAADRRKTTVIVAKESDPRP